MFPDEGHDVLKYENRVHCYNAITEFFRKHLMSEATQDNIELAVASSESA
jgi:hypothetical protein